MKSTGEQYALPPRRENRIPMAVAIQISGGARRPEIENTFTENVSSRGARILTQRAWRRNERVTIASLPSDFQSRARVAYCERLRETGFAIGLEFLEHSGHWVVDTSAASERTLQG